MPKIATGPTARFARPALHARTAPSAPNGWPEHPFGPERAAARCPYASRARPVPPGRAASSPSRPIRRQWPVFSGVPALPPRPTDAALLPPASLSRITHTPRQSRTAPLARFGSPGPIPPHGSPETFDSPVPPVPHLPLDQHVPRDRKDRCDL